MYNKESSEIKTPKRFFYVWNYLEWGGAQIYFFGLIKKARTLGEVRVILPNGSNEQLLKFLDNLVVPYEFFGEPIDSKPALTLKRKLQRHWTKIHSELTLVSYLRKLDLKDSIVHIEFSPWQSFLGLIWLCMRTNVFFTMHNSLPPVPKWRFLLWKFKFWFVTQFDSFHIFPSNQDTKESLKPFVSDNFLEKTVVTYTNANPLEIDEALAVEIDKTELLKKYNLPSDKFLVFCVGQFIDRKGRWIFLEAARKLLEVNQDIAFVWISNSKPTAEELIKAKEFNLGENFVLITSDQVGKEHIDLFILLRLADVFTLPSYVEGLPISLLEAMALRIPSISTNVNAIPEAIINMETGLLIEAGNSDELAEAIQKLKDNRELREKLAQNGREIVLEKFDERVVADIAIENYNKSFRR